MTGLVLCEVPDGNLAMVEDAPLREWQRATLSIAGKVKTVVTGPPAMIARWVAHWDRMFQCHTVKVERLSLEEVPT